MTFAEKVRNALARSAICVGLDTDMTLIPESVGRDLEGVLAFNKAIIDATIDLVGAFKPNFAFYEAMGPPGFQILSDTVDYIRKRSESVLTIADAKRGDIGNTAKMYVKSIFGEMEFDCVTVSPYMGYDSVAPFIDDEKKGAFVLCLTSNQGSADFQFHGRADVPLFLRVARQVVGWNGLKNCGLVVGATQTDNMALIRRAAPELPFLIPGIGTQGGNLLSAVRINQFRDGINAFISTSRSVLYASQKDDFADAARQSVIELNDFLKACTAGPPPGV